MAYPVLYKVINKFNKASAKWYFAMLYGVIISVTVLCRLINLINHEMQCVLYAAAGVAELEQALR